MAAGDIDISDVYLRLIAGSAVGLLVGVGGIQPGYNPSGVDLATAGHVASRHLNLPGKREAV